MKCNGNLLIVEDHADLAANVGDYMEAGGFVVDFAADGPAAVSLASSNHYDAIVLEERLRYARPWGRCKWKCRSLHYGQPEKASPKHSCHALLMND
jgi:hypothetical protein